MFEQIVNLVKEHIGSNPQLSSAIPADKQDEVSREVSQHITNGIKDQSSSSGGIMSMLQNAMGSGSTVTNAIEGGLVSSLTSKFGLPPMVTGAIAGALPNLIQKFIHKANDPNDSSVTSDSITSSLSGKFGGLGSLFGK